MPFFCYPSAQSMLILLLTIISTAQAALYITKPRSHSRCFGGRPCTIEYLDDGESPLLPQISLCEIGLYTGNQKLIQRIPPQDVSDTLSFTFTPNAKAGPNSPNYYIAFTSLSTKIDNGTFYVGYSPYFSSVFQVWFTSVADPSHPGLKGWRAHLIRLSQPRHLPSRFHLPQSQ
jgi:hypothetical protein